MAVVNQVEYEELSPLVSATVCRREAVRVAREQQDRILVDVRRILDSEGAKRANLYYNPVKGRIWLETTSYVTEKKSWYDVIVGRWTEEHFKEIARVINRLEITGGSLDDWLDQASEEVMLFIVVDKGGVYHNSSHINRSSLSMSERMMLHPQEMDLQLAKKWVEEMSYAYTSFTEEEEYALSVIAKDKVMSYMAESGDVSGLSWVFELEPSHFEDEEFSDQAYFNYFLYSLTRTGVWNTYKGSELLCAYFNRFLKQLGAAKVGSNLVSALHRAFPGSEHVDAKTLMSTLLQTELNPLADFIAGLNVYGPTGKEPFRLLSAVYVPGPQFDAKDKFETVKYSGWNDEVSPKAVRALINDFAHLDLWISEEQAYVLNFLANRGDEDAQYLLEEAKVVDRCEILISPMNIAIDFPRAEKFLASLAATN